MTTQIWEDTEIRDMALGLIAKHHPYLSQVEIRYLFAEKGSFLGKTQKASPSLKALASVDFVITINNKKWCEDLDSAQKLALVDHQLCWCSVEEDADDPGADLKLGIRKPTVSDFPEVVARHGAWQPEVLEYVRACNDGGASLTATALGVSLTPNPEADDSD